MTSRTDYIASIRKSLDDYCEICKADLEQAPVRGFETEQLEQLDRVAAMLAGPAIRYGQNRLKCK